MRNGIATLTFIVIGALATGAFAAPLGAADFRPTPERPFGWRGDGTGSFPGAAPVTDWSETRNIKWSATVGTGFASPVFAGDLVIVFSEPGTVVALGAVDGRVRWRAVAGPDDLPDPADRAAAREYEPPKDGAGFAAATPVTDGRSVYVVLASGIVRALDVATGKPAWARYVPTPQNTGYGRSASPVLAGGRLFVHLTNLHALDPATGKDVWVNEDAKSTYGTPVVTRVGHTDVLVTPAGDVVRAADGKTLATGLASVTHPSPVAAGATVFVAEGQVCATRLSDKFKDDQVWDFRLDGDVFGSPVLHGGRVLIVTGAGELFAFGTAAKGTLEHPALRRRLFAPPAEEGGGGGVPTVYASPALAGNHLFVTSTRGETVVLEAGPEMKEVARNRLPRGGAGGSPIFSGDRMWIRDGEKLYCIGR